jgi:hypothetical protein
VVWGSPYIRRRIEGPVGERTCTRGPASRRPGSASGWRGGGRSMAQTLSHGAARRGQVGRDPLSSAAGKGQFNCSMPGMRQAARSPGAQNPGLRGGTTGPITRRTTGWTRWSRLAALCPKGARAPRVTGSPRVVRGFGSPALSGWPNEPSWDRSDRAQRSYGWPNEPSWDRSDRAQGRAQERAGAAMRKIGSHIRPDALHKSPRVGAYA